MYDTAREAHTEHKMGRLDKKLCYLWIFPQMKGKLNKFGKSDKSLKHELGSIYLLGSYIYIYMFIFTGLKPFTVMAIFQSKFS